MDFSGHLWTSVDDGLWTEVDFSGEWTVDGRDFSADARTSPPSSAGRTTASVQCRTHRTSPRPVPDAPPAPPSSAGRTAPRLRPVPDALHLPPSSAGTLVPDARPRPFPETAARRKPSHQSVTDYRFRTGEASACKYFPASSGYIMTAARKASARSALAGLPTTTQTSSLIDGIMISSFDPVCPWWLIALWLLLMLAMAAWTYRRLRAHVQTSYRLLMLSLEIVLALLGLILLTQPLRTVKRPEPGSFRIAVLADQSLSMNTLDGNQTESRRQILTRLLNRETTPLQRLSAGWLDIHGFADDCQPVIYDGSTPTGTPRTDAW